MMFSIIIPLYNKKKQVADAINSVLAQTNSDYELLIIDDGSTDDSYSVAATFSDPRIQISRQKNCGVSVARNKGIQNAVGDYICFLDADDLWEPNHLEELMKLIEKYSGAGLYATRYRVIECDGTENVVPMKSDMLVEDFFKLELDTRSSPFIHTNSVCVPKYAFEKAGYFVPGERLGEDTSLWMRIAAYYDVALSKAITTTYRREYSEACTGLELPQKWSFFKYSNEKLLLDTGIPVNKRDNIAKFNNRYLLSLCRQSILLGEKGKARNFYKQVDFTYYSKWERLITDICFFVPSSVLRKAYYWKKHCSFFENRKTKKENEL